ncbi:uncharacterized protein G2W53_033263 [Senna tora]|uniref:Uncharacterized protein n=1 Tax=Senna tora TaxID=362788 RepID=A0A834W7S5_9FABA|nr:uncharacterized protein G2W53_033263 [Senna tora]
MAITAFSRHIQHRVSTDYLDNND